MPDRTRTTCPICHRRRMCQKRTVNVLRPQDIVAGWRNPSMGPMPNLEVRRVICDGCYQVRKDALARRAVHA